MTVPAAQTAPRSPQPRDDVQPVNHETRDRIITGTVTILPALALGVVAWQAWQSALHLHDLVVFAIVYFATGFGVTVGFHRHLTHRSFKTFAPIRALLAILGSAAIEGPVISWVADHRKHHAFSDKEGDPHSPHVDHGHGWSGALKGLAHAHLGWLFIHTQRGSRERYTPDLVSDPVIRFVDRTFVLWALLGLAVPFALGFALTGSIIGGLTGLLWGGLVRMFVLHHVTYSINSLCHFFGRQRFQTSDQSRNLLWLAIPSMGEAWHNNHHAFPTSSEHGMSRLERMLDLSAHVIWLMEKLGLAWNVVRISPDSQARKAIGAQTG